MKEFFNKIILWGVTILSIFVMFTGRMDFYTCTIKEGVQYVENGTPMYNPDGTVIWEQEPLIFHYGLFICVCLFIFCIYLWGKEIIKKINK